MSRGIRSSILIVASLAVLAVAVSAASASGPVARMAKTCGVGEGKGYSYSYLTSLTVNNTRCSTGYYVAHHHGYVKGWKCKRQTTASSPVQYDAQVTCKSGRRKVFWTFTQNK
jgi:hypothetical protein